MDVRRHAMSIPPFSVLILLAKILLTPFRMQNVPPPMSSLQLDLVASTSLHPIQVPVHTAFCVTKDVLAALWESGFVEVWSLNTRLEQGYGPVMKPSQVWAGKFDYCSKAHQIVAQEGPDNTLRLLILGVTDNGMDVLVDVSVEGGAVNAKVPRSIGMRSGRLITSDAGILYQSATGEVQEGKCFHRLNCS